ncbi:MAG: ATP-binding protein [Candidatus Altiarchaeota archaeon]|nr:ATP-binding protein [Candidatus Altiarchaeota archaeon]
MKIAVASGKGGVGKSMVASALAMLYANEKKVVAVDCDVDAPDLGIWLGMGEPRLDEPISTSEKAFIDYEKCSGCGRCAEVCRFGAVRFNGRPEILTYLCEGCGACAYFCPERAIEMRPVENGSLGVTETRFGFPLLTGLLKPGETCSGKIIADMKGRLDRFTYDVAVLDSAAGIGCPVIASLTGVDYAVLVTEPTPSGFSDLKRVLEVVRHFRTPYGLIINKWDMNRRLSGDIEKWAGEALLGKLSFDRGVFLALSNLVPILESGSVVASEIRDVFERMRDIT